MVEKEIHDERGGGSIYGLSKMPGGYKEGTRSLLHNSCVGFQKQLI